jgi:hypothetical protein
MQKAILWGEGDKGLSYSGMDEIPVSHLVQTLKLPQSQFDHADKVIYVG